jgi:hypothetical protein
MTTIVRGHGELASDRPKTFVPDGVVIKFYSDLDDPLWTANALAVLNSGDFGNPNQSYGPGSKASPVEIPNYEMSARSSGEVQRDLSADLGKAPILFIGDQITPAPIHLCEGTATTCKDGVHGCKGVFGLVHDNDIVYLACRGVEDEDKPGTDAIGPSGDTSFTDDFDSSVAKFKSLIQSDPSKAGSDFEQMDQARQAMFLTDTTIKNWSFIREAKKFALQDPEGFARQVAGMERDGNDSESLNAYKSDPELLKVIEDVKSGETWSTG